MSLRDLAVEFAETRRMRLDVDRTVKDLKAREDELKASILNELSAMGARTVSLPDVGRLTMKEGARYEIADIESFLTFNIESMVDHAQQGHPLADGVYLQRRVSNSAVDAMLEGCADEDVDVVLAKRGLRRVMEASLSFTRS